MESMIAGRMYCLDSVLEIKNYEGINYILLGEGSYEYSIYFGRNRKLDIPKDSYIVHITEDEYKLEKIEFDGMECNYLKKLKENNIYYDIPKSLQKSIHRWYSRFECAIGATYWDGNIKGFFGKNGYAITELSYIGDDRYESFEINLNKSKGSLYINEHMIIRMTGYDSPNEQFIKKLLMEEIDLDSKAFSAMLREVGKLNEFEYITFETK